MRTKWRYEQPVLFELAGGVLLEVLFRLLTEREQRDLLEPLAQKKRRILFRPPAEKTQWLLRLRPLAQGAQRLVFRPLIEVACWRLVQDLRSERSLLHSLADVCSVRARRSAPSVDPSGLQVR